MTYFEVKVRYTRYIADGKTEKAVYTALIQTLTFADAEAKALEQVQNYAMAGCDIEVQAEAVRQGKMFEHNDIKFSEYLPELYRVLKKGTHCYLMINSRHLPSSRSSHKR